MKYRRRQRWLRRFAFGLAFATVAVGGRVAPAFAKPDEGGTGGRYVSTAGWSGPVDENGIPLSAGMPSSDDQFIQVIPYLSHGVVTQAQASALAAPSGDELAFRNTIASQDPYLTDINVRQGESLGGPDGGTMSFGILGEMVKSRQPAAPYVPGVTDFPQAAAIATPTRPDDRADRFTGVQQPPVISYLSHGMGTDGEVGARPDNRADRFAHSDVPTQTSVSSSGWNIEWNEALTFGIGGLVLLLALGLGLGYLRRPRLAL
jgi:hypothetical protein